MRISRSVRATAACALLTILPAAVSATWSVIAVDLATGRIVIASATCVNNNDMFLMGVQAVVVPGKGVAACQAGVDGTHANQMLVYNEIMKGTDPKRDHRAALRGSVVPVTAVRHSRSAGPQRGSLRFEQRLRLAGHPGPGSWYPDLLFDPGQHPAARRGDPERRACIHSHQRRHHRSRDGGAEVADQFGGDSRCTCPPLPADGAKPANPCEGKTSHIAYILMSERNDLVGEGTPRTTDNTWMHNNGKYKMYITVAQPGRSGGSGNEIKAGENLNPVKTLRVRYDAWRKQQPASFR